MESAILGCSRVVVIDTLGNFWGTHRCPPGFKVFRNTKALAAALRSHVRLPFKFIYQPVTGDKCEQFEIVVLLACAAGWCVIAVDELDLYCDAGNMSLVPKKRRIQLIPKFPQGALYEVANFSRHKPIAFIGVSRRPQQVPRGFTGQCSEMWIFRMTEPNELAYFGRTIGETMARHLPRLEQYTYLRYLDGSLDPPAVLGGRR